MTIWNTGFAFGSANRFEPQLPLLDGPSVDRVFRRSPSGANFHRVTSLSQQSGRKAVMSYHILLVIVEEFPDVFQTISPVAIMMRTAVYLPKTEAASSNLFLLFLSFLFSIFGGLMNFL